MKNSNEHIHLSDRLVTCGEYQPFLDEMCAQGRFHQPDHWTSTQFPDGQADEPVLGLRPSDAVAYCYWLTERGNNGWTFRLPSIQEGIDHPIKFPVKLPLGYWVTASEGQTQFCWIGKAPTDARGIDLVRAFTQTIENTFANISEQERARNLALDLLRIFDLEQSLKRPLDLDRDLSMARRHARENASVLQVDPAPELVMSLDQSLDRDLDRAIDLRYALERSDEHSSALEHARRHALIQVLEPGHVMDRSIAIDLLIYIDLFTLQERITGRSPAFEGIRVLKEKRP